ncbi:MAG: patatin family protein [Lachnospiraceae bacterium]|nr:patatin family protein [Lachnospiraceae bacterium]
MAKTGLILEGGAIRGIYSAGVLDYLLEVDQRFDYVIGVSAGCGNAANFVSRQIGRSKKVITHEGLESFWGARSFKNSRKFMNLDILVDQYALEDARFDFDTFYQSETDLECIAIDCETGKARYFEKPYEDDQRLLLVSKASCSVPYACKPVEIDGHFYLDGSLADSIPVERAMHKGCEKMLVVMTRPESKGATNYAKVKRITRKFYGKKYPKLCETMEHRGVAYKRQLRLLHKLEAEGKVFIMCPEKTIGHFEKNKEKVEAFYRYGYLSMKNRYEEFKAFLEK